MLVCEHADDNTVRLSCTDNKVIHILSAMYGRNERDPGSCPCGFFGPCDTNCRSSDALRRVKDRCEGLPSCKFKADNAVFGDPCARTRKYVQLEYKCDFKVGRYLMIGLFNLNLIFYLILN